MPAAKEPSAFPASVGYTQVVLDVHREFSTWNWRLKYCFLPSIKAVFHTNVVKPANSVAARWCQSCTEAL